MTAKGQLFDAWLDDVQSGGVPVWIRPAVRHWYSARANGVPWDDLPERPSVGTIAVSADTMAHLWESPGISCGSNLRLGQGAYPRKALRDKVP